MPVTFNTLAGWLRGRTDGFGHHASGDIDAACELDAADRAVRAHIATLTAELSDAHLFHAEQRKIFKGLEDRLAERDARIATIEAAASDATEYVLAQINAQLRTDNDSLRQRLAAAEAWQKWGEKYGRLAYVALVNLPYGQWDYALRDMPAGAK
jgi:vacuolar-type H+-ATPase subunit I/STV1